MSARCVVALGANLGDRLAALRSAVIQLDRVPRITVVRCSPVVASRAVGGPADSPDYLNAVVELRVDLTPEQVLRECQRIENEHGRHRTTRWAPRTLDLDIVWFEGVEQQEDELILPHPRAHERAFVLVPWSLLDPQAQLDGRPVRELARHAPDLAGLTTTNLRLCEGNAGCAGTGVNRGPEPRTEPGHPPSEPERS